MDDYGMFISKITEMTGITYERIVDVYRKSELSEHSELCALFMDKFQLSYGFSNTLVDIVQTSENNKNK